MGSKSISKVDHLLKLIPSESHFKMAKQYKMKLVFTV